MFKHIALALCVVLAACSAPAVGPQTVQVTHDVPVTVEVTREVPVTQIVEVTRVVAPTAPPATATLAATTAPTAAPTAAGPVGVATPQQVGTIVFTVLILKGAKSTNQFTVAKAGNVFVICDVLIQNLGPDKASYNPFYFKVKDADGFEYGFADAPDPRLNSGDLTAGDKVRGNIAFEVPQMAKALVMTYDPSIVGLQVVQVSLGDAPTVK